jgi:2-iminobutanoate/2-iminopropanoate deaminase
VPQEKIMRRTIASPRAPKAIGPYSQAVVTHHVPGMQMLHAAGQIPIDPATGDLVAGDVTAQAERVMENIAAVLEHAGMSFAEVVKTTVFLVDLADFAAMNEVYARRFKGEFPARSTIQVAGLPKGARIEVEVHAVKHPAAPGRSKPRKPARKKARR